MQNAAEVVRVGHHPMLQLGHIWVAYSRLEWALLAGDIRFRFELRLAILTSETSTEGFTGRKLAANSTTGSTFGGAHREVQRAQMACWCLRTIQIVDSGAVQPHDSGIDPNHRIVHGDPRGAKSTAHISQIPKHLAGRVVQLELVQLNTPTADGRHTSTHQAIGFGAADEAARTDAVLVCSLFGKNLDSTAQAAGRACLEQELAGPLVPFCLYGATSLLSGRVKEAHASPDLL
mmetsp:Transcript_62550/g.149081  ORF Transcript_62550/g.149081 Transcript_62550/m.149081 type:complete len:233 (-) Transcript_62550:1201-1899(-)